MCSKIVQTTCTIFKECHEIPFKKKHVWKSITPLENTKSSKLNIYEEFNVVGLWKRAANKSDHSGSGIIENLQFCVELCHSFVLTWSLCRRMCLHHGHGVEECVYTIVML